MVADWEVEGEDARNCISRGLSKKGRNLSEMRTSGEWKDDCLAGRGNRARNLPRRVSKQGARGLVLVA